MKQEDIVFKVQGPRTSEDDIARAEVELGVQFPTDYRMFLLKNNGGRSKLLVSADSNIGIDKWLSVTDIDELPIFSIVKGNRNVADEIGRDYMVIGLTVGDTYVLMKTRAPDKYHIGFWHPDECPIDKCKLTFKSFTDLINNLTQTDNSY